MALSLTFFSGFCVFLLFLTGLPHADTESLYIEAPTTGVICFVVYPTSTYADRFGLSYLTIDRRKAQTMINRQLVVCICLITAISLTSCKAGNKNSQSATESTNSSPAGG